MSSGGPSRPKDWDPRVAELVQFVQDERGLLFDHPVEVDFLTPEEYSAVTRGNAELSDDDQADIEKVEGEMRAVGLVTGDVDLAESFRTLSDDGTLAFYDFHSEKVTVRGEELTPAVRVTLVHELTHALQDQHFNLDQLETLEGSDAQEGFRALVEGDATRIENRYVDSLAEPQQQVYEQESNDQSSDADLSDVPPALLAYFGAPYVLGTDLVELIAATGGNSAVNAAFDRPPSSEADLLDPFRYLARSGATDVDVPALAPNEKHFDDGDMGAIALYFVLTSQFDPHDALRAIDGWDGDAYVGFERDGRSCIRMAVAGTDPVATARLADLLDGWTRGVPDMAAKAHLEGTDVMFESCDPGTHPIGNTLEFKKDALALPVVRAELGLEFVRRGTPPAPARCIAGKIVDAYSVDELLAADPAQFQTAEFVQQVSGFAQECSGG